MLLQDKVIIVSGIGPGLGVKLAVEAARAGAHAVVCAARTAAKLNDAETRVLALGGRTEVMKVPTDITDRDACAALVAAAAERYGRVDALVNSAYVHGDYASSEDSPLDGWQEAFATNVLGSMKITQAVIPQMKRQGGGAILMINTIGTAKPYPGGAGYAVSKGGLAVAAKYLAKELGPYNIRVNSAYMGWMWGVPVQQAIQRTAAAQGVSEDDVLKPILANIPLGRMMTDDECARAALMLVSDYAAPITGASLDISGGEVMR